MFVVWHIGMSMLMPPMPSTLCSLWLFFFKKNKKVLGISTEDKTWEMRLALEKCPCKSSPAE